MFGPVELKSICPGWGDLSQSLKALSILGIGCLFSQSTSALTFSTPTNGDVIGYIQKTEVRPGDNLATIGRRFDVGGYEMTEANPKISYLNPRVGTRLVIPTRYILPSGARKGIVLNLAEMRLYFYHPGGKKISTYPIGIGKQGWDTPIGTTRIVRKREGPTWVVPDSILANYKRLGKPIAKTMPPGPKNPLGAFALSLGIPNIVIHGTPYPRGIGVRSSHGCIRMLPEDISKLFQQVKVGTAVRIVHEPNKVGRLGKQLVMEAHVPLKESRYHVNSKSIPDRLKSVVQRSGYKAYKVSWSQTERLKMRASGYPEVIGSVGR